MNKKWKQKCYAWLLAAAMAVTALPSVSLTAEAAAPELLADFDFNADASGGVFAGGNAKAKVSGGCTTKVKSEGDSALYLNGTDAFLSLTKSGSGLNTSLLRGKDNITISYDARPEGAAGWTVFAAPNGNAQTYGQEHYLGLLHTTSRMLVERYNNSGERPANSIETTPGSGWIHVDLVVSETTTKLYVNGEKKGEQTSDYKLSSILGTGLFATSIVQVGKGNWNDGEFYKGYIDNYRIYDGTLSEEDIAAQYQEFEDSMEAMKKYEEEEQERQKQQALQNDYDALVILNSDDVRGNLSLVKEGRYHSKIEWTSSKPAVVTDSAQSGLYDGGVVTRPEAGEQPVEVELTANLTSAYFPEQSMTKTFTVTVQPKEDVDTDYTKGYLWTNFGTSGGYEKIFFGYSEDGLTWEKINKKDGTPEPILTNDAEGSDKGVRDPHLLRSAEGDRYWILGTDLHAEGGGQGGSGWNQLSASQNLVVWESTDLVNWSAPRLVYAGFDNAGCVWAPEAIYDDTTGDYVVYWSARDKSLADTEDNALRVYVCRTRDFNTFSEPKVWLSEDAATGGEVNIIDTTIVKDDDGKFYRFSTSDWNTVIDVSDTLDTEDVLDARVDESMSKPNGSWTRLVSRGGSDAAGFDGREGLTVYKLPDGRWCVMGDSEGYRAFVTNDLSSGKFTSATSNFVDGNFRHGTVTGLSTAEKERVLAAFDNKDTESDDAAEEPVLFYDFEGDEGKTVTDIGMGDNKADNATLKGNAAVVYDSERKSNVLKLDGTSNTYAELPRGFFDRRDQMTISMDVKSELDSGDFFTFTYGQNSTKYNFLRVRGTAVRNAITVSGNGSEHDVNGSGTLTGEWQRIVLVINKKSMRLYLDGTLVDTNSNTGILTSDLGTNLLAYLGKSFYGPDAYFKGSFDNFKVYNRVLKEEEIVGDALKDESIPLLKNAVIGTVPAYPLDLRGTDDHTAVFSSIDRDNKQIISYLRRGTSLLSVPVKLTLLTKDVVVSADDGAFTGTLDLSKDVKLDIAYAGRQESYTIKIPEYAGNPVLPGQYADPDIDYFDGKFWIFPTTDGYPGWSGTLFHAFSSPDMVTWEDEGIIMELKNQNPGLNDKGVQIAKSPWAVDGSAWAPTIEKKNGKYYFYYCGKKSGGESAIGVAVADNPAGPYTDKGQPLMTVAMCSAAGVEMGQAIDPSIFTDDDGTSYILFGNGNAAIAQLGDDMVSIKSGTLRQINGLTDFRESVIVTKVKGKYHWTWSCDDANSPNYHVNYGVSDKLLPASGPVNVTYKKANLLSKDESKGILGSAHQSVVHVKDASGKDRYFMAYHRFYTPVGIFTDSFGVHRETCIDEITFDANGEMVITPTQEGVSAVEVIHGDIRLEVDVTEKENGEIEVSVERFVPGEGSAVSIVLPDSLADIITNSQKETVSINVDIPDVLLESVEAVTLPEKVLEAAKSAGKNITVTVNGDSSYQWVFTAEELESATISDLNLLVEKDSPEDADVKEALNDDEEGMVFSFAQQETVPGSVIVDASGMKWKEGDEVSLSYYNSETESLELVDTYTLDESGKITIKNPKGRSYVLWRKILVEVTGITLDETSLELTVGASKKLEATVEPDKATNKTVTWKSDNEDVATVDENGEVEAIAAGTATITATASNGMKASCTVTVNNPAGGDDPVEGDDPAGGGGPTGGGPTGGGSPVGGSSQTKVNKVTLNKKSLKLGVKEKFTLKATVDPANATNPAVTYKSDNPGVVTVSEKTGLVTAKKKGKATITATADGVTERCTIVVKAAPKKITLKAKNKTLKKGKTFQIKYKLPKNTASNKITYTSNKKKVATVSATGKVKAVKAGKATITVKTFNNKKAKIVITVK